jgi:hypothetical protein
VAILTNINILKIMKIAMRFTCFIVVFSYILSDIKIQFKNLNLSIAVVGGQNIVKYDGRDVTSFEFIDIQESKDILMRLYLSDGGYALRYTHESQILKQEIIACAEAFGLTSLEGIVKVSDLKEEFLRSTSWGIKLGRETEFYAGDDHILSLKHSYSL